MKKLISEDDVQKSHQKLMAGTKDSSPTATTVNNLMKGNNRDDNSLAPVLKPYPLNMADDVLSDMFIATMNMQKMLDNVKANPSLKKQYNGLINQMIEKVQVISDVIVELSEDLDKIGNG